MSQTESEIVQGIGSDYEVKYGFHVPEDYFFKSGKGLSHELIDAISSHKDEPDWMRKFRHRSLDYFLARPMPTWGGMPSLHEIDFDSIHYYIKPTENQAESWEDLAGKLKMPEGPKSDSATVNKLRVLNHLGRQGWEMVSAALPTTLSPAPATLVFKRKAK